MGICEGHGGGGCRGVGAAWLGGGGDGGGGGAFVGGSLVRCGGGAFFAFDGGAFVGDGSPSGAAGHGCGGGGGGGGAGGAGGAFGCCCCRESPGGDAGRREEAPMAAGPDDDEAPLLWAGPIADCTDNMPPRAGIGILVGPVGVPARQWPNQWSVYKGW